ncbi:Tar ligand binding domain-containing protein [Paraburkholderia graminis]|uniref:Tar ligand binding domain-containing protein n=1 Tax=Paraburkholderia graminis TaxID=60548 RepID=UPI0038B89223
MRLAFCDVLVARARFSLDRYAFDPATGKGSGLRERAEKCLTESDEWYKKYDPIPRGSDEDRQAKIAVDAREQMRKRSTWFGHRKG